MYYRVAIQRQGDQLDRPPSWQWKSTVLSSLQTLFQFLRLYGALPQDQLQVFSSSSREGLAEQLEQENKGLTSNSVTAAQFLRERLIRPPAEVGRTSEREVGASLEMVSIEVISQQPLHESGRGVSALDGRGMSSLERWREGSQIGLVRRKKTGSAWERERVALVGAHSLESDAGARGLLECIIRTTKPVGEPATWHFRRIYWHEVQKRSQKYGDPNMLIIQELDF